MKDTYIELDFDGIKLLNYAQKEHGRNKCYALFSGGKDSMTLTHWLQSINRLEGVIAVDTTINVPDWKSFVEKTCKQYDWNLTFVTPPITYEQYVRKLNFPHPGAHYIVMDWLKRKPIEKWWRSQKNNNLLLCSGVRHDESTNRFGSVKAISVIHNLWYCAPIKNMTNKQRDDYITEYNLPISPAYPILHISGDCLCGTYFNRGSSILVAMFYPEIAQRILVLEKELSKKHVKNCKWGNDTPSMEEAISQRKIEDYLCTECKSVD